MTLTTFLQLGRVSNLPTVWTNTLAGAVLAGGLASSMLDWRLLVLLIAMTLAYTGGMFLNDAFDRDIDSKERPERPIPAGDVNASSVFTAGFAMLAASIGLVAWCAFTNPDSGGWWAVVAALALAAAIVLYNVWHKSNPISPFIMGVCRMLVYVTAGLTFTHSPSSAMIIGAVVLLLYLIGLTYTAKQENLGEVKNMWPLIFLIAPALTVVLPLGIFSTITPLVWLLLVLFIGWLLFALSFVRRRKPGDIPRAVVSMIAGISLIDALLITSTANLGLVVLAIAAFLLTLFLQRYVAGT